MKVCAICDRFISPNCEAFITLKDLKDKHWQHFHQDLIEDPYDLDGPAKRALKKHYTQKHFRDTEDHWLNEMILSPMSCGTDPTNKRVKKNWDVARNARKVCEPRTGGVKKIKMAIHAGLPLQMVS